MRILIEEGARVEIEAMFKADIAEQRALARHAINGFVTCVTEGAIERLSECLCALELTGATTQAFRAIGRGNGAPDSFRQAFVDVWISSGDHIRSEVNDEIVLKGALRRLLPHYEGASLTLYRGDSAFNRQRRTYGLSWTSNLETARDFAGRICRTFEGGSVVLKSIVSPEAIICAPALHSHAYGEKEYLVDRRKLSRVQVIERLPQISLAASAAPP
ncbi:MAG: hypothetical protein JO107_16430 [Hyphomicrobiales bacterium]|nr:hypothetical protein [Hyphomicrobiales bacterium]MBV8664675.1 hypothetical protein [Hyphomicrobiales bacterium]